ncbi:MAG: bifunctional riboflavin kinase/FAD synthetase [Hyphomonadaceae bacterium]
MQIYAGGTRGERPCAVALGNFDGVHLGHQAVVADAARAARALGLPLAACVFEPHPRQFLQPEGAPFRLQSPGQRARALEALGVEALYELKFDADLMRESDEEFARNQLSGVIGARHVSVGADFTFGRARMGDAASLSRLGAALGFSVGVVGVVGDAAGKVSSSAIRAAIAEGRPEEAQRLLSRPWAIEGFVLPGQARGRTIGFPTANVALGQYVRPRYGVYAVRVSVDGGAWLPGVANIGVKPTIGGAQEPLLEAHLFDVKRDLYGRRIEATLIAFIRPEQKFDSFAALTAQIAADADTARRLLG